MHRIVEWFKQHPYLGGSLAVGVFILWMVKRRASAAAQAQAQAQPAQAAAGVDPTTAALQAAELQSATGITAAQIQGQQTIALANAALNGQALQYGAQVQIAQLASQDQLQQTISAQDVQDNQTAASLALGLAQAGQTPIFSGTIGGLSFAGVNPAQPAASIASPVSTTPAAPVGPVVSSGASSTYTPVLAPAAAVPSGASTFVPPSSPAPAIYAPMTGGGYVVPQVAQGTAVASGSNYEATYDVIPGGVQNPYNQFGVAQQAANVDAAETAYVLDPNSCHNSTSPNCTPLY